MTSSMIIHMSLHLRRNSLPKILPNQNPLLIHSNDHYLMNQLSLLPNPGPALEEDWWVCTNNQLRNSQQPFKIFLIKKKKKNLKNCKKTPQWRILRSNQIKMMMLMLNRYSRIQELEWGDHSREEGLKYPHKDKNLTLFQSPKEWCRLWIKKIIFKNQK